MMPIDTSSRSKCESKEISHLIKKGYSRDRAVAAAKEICKEVSKNEVVKELISTIMELRKLAEREND